MSQYRDRFVREAVIRDDCPCPDCAADNRIEIRAAGVAVAPGLLAIAFNALVGAQGLLAIVVPILLVFLTAKVVTGAIDRHNEAYGCVSDTDVIG